MIQVTPSQERALSRLHSLVSSNDLRPTYVLTGPPGVGKSTVVRMLDGEYHNFTLEWLTEFFGARNPLFLQDAALVSFLIGKVEASISPLVVLDGLEPALVGLVPTRRKEIAGIIQSLMRQSTGRRLVLVVTSAPGSPFLTPGFADEWAESGKVVTLNFTPEDASHMARILGLSPEGTASAGNLYEVLHESHSDKE